MEIILNESRKTYLSKINQVQDYIENHLEEELNIKKLAEIAQFSEFHFQRIFRQFTGESLYSYMKRVRLEKSVFLLRANKQRTIQDIALSVGFTNQASFAKALKERFGTTASVIKKCEESKLSRLLSGDCFSENSTNGKVYPDIMNYNVPVELSIKKIDPVDVIYIRNTGSYKGDAYLFGQLFMKINKYGEEKKLITSQTKWFVTYHDYNNLSGEEKLRLSVCISVPKNVKGTGEFGNMTIAGGKYAVGRFLLKSDEFQGAWNYMILKWLPESGYLPDDRLCFEYYPPDVHQNKEETMVEIFIPITPL